MNRAPRELIEDLQAALIAEHQARKALREASNRGVPWKDQRPMSHAGQEARTGGDRVWNSDARSACYLMSA